MIRFVVAVTPEPGTLTEWQFRSSPLEGAKSGDPLPWCFRIDGDVPKEGEERHFNFYCGDQYKFTMQGSFAVAVAVVSALGRGAELTRLSMRFAMSVPQVAEAIGETARVPEEYEKAQGFMQWLGLLGTTLLVAGLRPWIGTVGDVQSQPAPGVVVGSVSEEVN